MDNGRDANGIKSLNRYTLERIVALSSDGILLADARDPNLAIVYVNPAYEALTGYSVDELAGQGWSLARRSAEGEPELQEIKAAIGRAESCCVTVPDVRKDGTSWLARVSVEPLHNARGELKYFLCVQKPVTSPQGGEALGGVEAGDPSSEVSLLQRELGRARQKIATLDRLDPATGLLRFSYFQETLRRDLKVARRDEGFVTLLLFAIDEFDAYRKTFGDKAADSCQRMIGAQIARTLRRAGDLCARYDDSTLVAAVLGQSPEDAQPLAERIADNVRRLGLHNPRAKQSRHVTIQTAVVACPLGQAEDAEALIESALTELRRDRAARAAEAS